jgi:hypothetical protein
LRTSGQQTAGAALQPPTVATGLIPVVPLVLSVRVAPAATVAGAGYGNEWVLAAVAAAVGFLAPAAPAISVAPAEVPFRISQATRLTPAIGELIRPDHRAYRLQTEWVTSAYHLPYREPGSRPGTGQSSTEVRAPNPRTSSTGPGLDRASASIPLSCTTTVSCIPSRGPQSCFADR